MIHLQIRWSTILTVTVVILHLTFAINSVAQGQISQQDIVITALDTNNFPAVEVSIAGQGSFDANTVTIYEDGEPVPVDRSLTIMPGSGRQIAFLVDLRASTGEQYTVQPGNTLTSIAAQYGTTVDELRRANNLTSNDIFSGQPLTVPEVGQTLAQAKELTIAAGERVRALNQLNILNDADQMAFFVPKPDGRSLQTVQDWTTDHVEAANTIYEPKNQPYLEDESNLPETTELDSLISEARKAFDENSSTPAILVIFTDAANNLAEADSDILIHVANPLQDASELNSFWQSLPWMAHATYRSQNPQPRMVEVSMGNLKSAPQPIFALNIQPPQIRIATPNRGEEFAISKGASSLSIPIEIDWSFPNYSDREVRSIEYQLGNGPAIEIPPASGNTANFSLDEVPKGAYDLTIILEDELGLRGETNTNFTVAPLPFQMPTPLFWVIGSLLIVVVMMVAYKLYRHFVTGGAGPGNGKGDTEPYDGTEKTEPYDKDQPVIARLTLINVRKGDPPARNVIEITKPITKLGRNASVVDEKIDSKFVSRLHCTLKEHNGKYFIADEGATTKTYINEEVVDLETGPEKPIRDGEILRLGPLEYRFEILNDPNKTQPLGEPETDIYD